MGILCIFRTSPRTSFRQPTPHPTRNQVLSEAKRETKQRPFGYSIPPNPCTPKMESMQNQKGPHLISPHLFSPPSRTSDQNRAAPLGTAEPRNCSAPLLGSVHDDLLHLPRGIRHRDPKVVLPGAHGPVTPGAHEEREQGTTGAGLRGGKGGKRWFWGVECQGV